MSDIPIQSADDADDADLLAAEYALGVLGGAAMRQAERRLRRDLSFAAEVAGWQSRLSPMIAAIEPVAPPADLWRGIAGDLGRMTRASVNDAAERAPKPKGRRVSSLWQWFGLGSFGLATASLAALLVVVRPGAVPTPMTASIAAEGGVPLYTAVVYPGAAGVTLVPVSTASAPGHAHELWILGPDAAPRSLGVLAVPGPLQISIPPELLANGRVLAISLEPLGGSPTGQPTGPVVAKGELISL